jgi:hypothetical protein
MKIEVQIGQLVLEGFDYHDHKRIADAMKVELAKMIAEKGLGEIAAGRSKDTGPLSIPVFRIPSDKNPRLIGNEIARSVYKSLKQRATAAPSRHR